MKRKLSIILALTLILTSFSAVINTNIAYAASPNIKEVNAGSINFSVILKNDGTVWGWGDNSHGQLGDGTTINKTNPVKVNDLDNIVDISAGNAYTLATKNDGTVWAWGNNSHGELGDGTNVNKNIPVQVNNLDNVISISTGFYHSLALKEDGTVWIWGSNQYGQLGDGTSIYKSTPVKVNNLDNVVDISAGCFHSLVLKNDGTVWAWGRNHYGQLGDGTNENSNIPIQIETLENIVDISIDNYHSLALKSDGTVWTWGSNSSGQLGNGDNIDQNTPVQVNNLNNIIDISAGRIHSLALKEDGTVWAWGANGNGQLGDGTNIEKNIPVQVNDLNNIVSISTRDNHSLAIKNDGTVWAWGRNTLGQLGDGTKENSNIPIQIFTDISVPNAPLNLTAVGGNDTVTLNWDDVNECNGYNIYRTTTSGDSYDLISASVTTSSYIDLDVTNGTTYYYVVTAVNTDGESDYSNEASATVKSTGIILDIEPEKDTIKLNETITANLVIDNITEIAAEDISINYDNQKLEFLGFEETDEIKLVKAIESTDSGKLRVILASKGEANIVNSKKILLKLKFKGIATGEAIVDITKGRVTDGIEMEKDLEETECDQATIIIEEIIDVNNTGEFTLIDLGIDARHLLKDPSDPELAQYNTDIVVNNAIDEDDLLEIGKLLLENPNYTPNN